MPKEPKANDEVNRKESNNEIQPNIGTNNKSNNAEVVSKLPASIKILESYSIDASQPALKCGQLGSASFVSKDNLLYQKKTN